jgi:hypothetical protein
MNKDQKKLISIYDMILLENQRFDSSKGFNDELDEHGINKEQWKIFKQIENYFKDVVMDKISIVRTPSMDYGYVGEEETLEDMFIMIDRIHLAYDVNINADKSVEQQISLVEDKVKSILQQSNLNEFVDFEVEYQKDNKFLNDYEVANTRNEWIGINVYFKDDNHLSIKEFKNFCNLLISLDKNLRSLENLML